MSDNILNNCYYIFVAVFLGCFVLVGCILVLKFLIEEYNHNVQEMLSIRECKYNHKWAVCTALEQDTGGGFVSCTDIVYHPLGQEFDTYEEAKEFYNSHTIDELRSLPIIQPKIECEKCKICPLYAKGCKEFNVYGQCLRSK